MSTLKVDTYLTRGGASEIAIDKLKGVTAAGSMLVVGEGGTVTTNVQQGLAKCWAQSAGAGTSIADSFNAASITDVGTGSLDVNYTSDMANDDCSLTIGHQFTSLSGTGAFFPNVADRSTSSHRVNHFQNAAATDPTFYNSTIHGDLA